jgi:1,4-dihydroxy-6-naphthoate synthase
VAYAMGYARDMETDLADRFIKMYVNKWTLDFGHAGRRAVQTFLLQAHAAGLTPHPGEIDFVSPTGVE